MKIAILTDSGCAMTPNEAKDAGLFLLPLQIIDGDETYQDGVEITTEELYKRLKLNHTPKTSMPILNDIQNTMKEIKRLGYDEIVAIPLSSGLSSTCNSIRISAEEMHIPVTIIENFTTCDLQGYSAIHAKKLADEGLSASQIKAKLDEKIATSGTIIIPNDIQHLKRGGRLTPIAAAAASLLKIKPILKIDPSTNGKIDVFGKVRTEKKATVQAIEYIRSKMSDKEGTVYVIHSDNLQKANEIRDELQIMNPKLNIKIHTISAVIAAHTGLDCVAIQYIEK